MHLSPCSSKQEIPKRSRHWSLEPKYCLTHKDKIRLCFYMKMQMEASKSLISLKKIHVPQFFLFLKVFQAVCIDNMLFVRVLKNVYV